MQFPPALRFMALSALAFAAMSACAKAASPRIPSQEIVLARAVVALALSFAMVRRAGVPPFGKHRGLLFLRGVFGFGGLSCVFYAVAHLPLAEATVLQYLYPLLTALLARPLLGEITGRGVWLASVLCLGGVLLVSKPSALFGGSALDPLAVGVGALGAFFTACAYVDIRKLSGREHPLVIVLYFPMITVPLTLPLLVGRAVMPEGVEWLLLVAVGVLAQLGQLALTRGIASAPAAQATTYSYLQVPFAALLGFAFFGERPDFASALGALAILAGSFLVLRSQ
jgi:drug/metabolite transporter (DMT)-like permease